MVHSQKTKKKIERTKADLKRRVKNLQKLFTIQHRNVETITLPYVSLGDLRRRWKQDETELDPALLSRISQFRRFKINADQSLCIKGSDDGLLAYVSNINRSELVDRLYESIVALPDPKRYNHKGIVRSDSRIWHFCVWAKYDKIPFLCKELRDMLDVGMGFLKMNREVFRIMSGMLGQVVPGVFKTFQRYPLPNGLERLCGAWLECAVNHGRQDQGKTKIHRDASEAQYGYSGLISCGNYEGGGLILYELEIILELQPGDIVIFPDALINHSNEPVKGERCSVVAFTQENVYNYWAREYNLTLRRKLRKSKMEERGSEKKPLKK